MRVEILHYNWRAAGSTSDRDGAGEDFDHATVGKKGVTAIEISLLKSKNLTNRQKYNLMLQMIPPTDFEEVNP